MTDRDSFDEEDSSAVSYLVPAKPERTGKKSRDCHVLVVEENPADFQRIERYLEDVPGIEFRLTRAVRLREGIKLLAAGGIDVVLLDLLLPDSRGIETFQKMNFHAELSPIIVLTELDDQSLAIQAAREGAQDYLIKGRFDSDLLVRSIRYSITRNRAQKKLTRALREARATAENLRNVITNNVDGMVVVDRRGVVRFLNPAAEALFGRSGDELLGDPFGFPLASCESREIEILRSDGARVPVEMRGIEVAWKRKPAVLAVLRDLTFQKQAEKEREERLVQLEIAHEIQQQFLPHDPPVLAGVDIAGALYPAELAAGDYFDYLPMPDGAICLAVGDVSGHGFGPALLMAATCAHLRSLVQVSTDIEEILSLLNRALAERTADEHYVTFLLTRLDVRTGSLTYASAGHRTGYVLNRSGEEKTSLPSTGIPLAIDSEAEFPAGTTVRLEPGDTVVLLTDGVLEAKSPAGEYFGEQDVLDVVRANQTRSAHDIIDAVYRAIQEFTGCDTAEDDITLVVVKCQPPDRAPEQPSFAVSDES